MAARTEKVSFQGSQGTLDARLDQPEGTPTAFALFAHCFTCSKSSSAVTRISRALAAQGLAVLRFDFTGLGGSEGEFANTSFTSNIQDLVHAANFMRDTLAAPALAIGHSLGGTAVLAAASQISELEAVVTLNAPCDPEHVKKLLTGARPELDQSGAAEVDIGGRTFCITKQFLEDIEQHDMHDQIEQLGKALLVMHAPADRVVDVDNARRIFEAAKHPKSFVSLDDANHLLTNRRDAVYAAHVLAAWASRYVVGNQEAEPGATARAAEALLTAEEGEILVQETGEGKFTQDVHVGQHRLVSDEPISVGGKDAGPSPYDLLCAALGSCTSMTLRLYAEHKKLALEHVAVRLRHHKTYAKDCDECETRTGKVDVIDRKIEVQGDLTDEQRARLLEIADKCPVHRTLHSEVRVRSELVEPDRE